MTKINLLLRFAISKQPQTEDEFCSHRYAYQILFVRKAANRMGQADKVVEFVSPDSHLAKEVNKEYAMIKETEKEKFLPDEIVKTMQGKGFKRFNMHHHTQLWKKKDAKNQAYGFGVLVTGKQGKQWYGYE